MVLYNLQSENNQPLIYVTQDHAFKLIKKKPTLSLRTIKNIYISLNTSFSSSSVLVITNWLNIFVWGGVDGDSHCICVRIRLTHNYI